MSSSALATAPKLSQSSSSSTPGPPPRAPMAGRPATGFSYSNSEWQPDQALTVEAVTEPVRVRRSGVEIMFLPDVKRFETQLELGQLKKDITAAFNVPDFFWSEAGYEANGFVSYKKSPVPNYKGTSYGITSRFLIKQIKPKGDEYEYGWEYLSFVSLWYRPAKTASGGSTGEPTQLLLCFDLSPEMKNSIANAFRESDPSAWRHCPFGVYSVMVPLISRWFNDALWQFRLPIRNIEKNRLRPDQPTAAKDMARRYIAMHELSRHVIHEIETLQISSRTLASIAQHHDNYNHKHISASSSSSSEDDDDGHENGCSPDLKFYHRFLENLHLRAVAFDKRLQNEIRLAFNLSAADDNATAKEILQDGQNDGRELTQLVSTATLLFLPGSFISSVFGMNFFQYGDRNVDTSDQIYIFVVVTIAVTIAAFGVWRFFVVRSRRGKARNSSKSPGSRVATMDAVDLEKRLVRGTTFPGIIGSS